MTARQTAQTTTLEERETTALHDRPSVAELLRDLRDETSMLFRQEVELAKKETSEKVSTAIRNTSYLAIGGAILFAGFLFFLAAVTAAVGLALEAAGLNDAVVAWLAPLIVGAVVMIIGAALLAKGRSTLKHMSVRPEKTVESMKENTQWLKEKTRRRDVPHGSTESTAHPTPSE